MAQIYLLLGSNLGNREWQLSEAAGRIAAGAGRLISSSSLYLTESWGASGEPDYLNQVICIESALDPYGLLTMTQAVENDLGRERSKKWGARTIDIDILFFDDLVMSGPGLTIPHTLLHERRFTLMPLAEIAPGLIHPVLKKTVAALLDNLFDNLSVKKLNS